jgi:predicted nucleic acid-binding protein
LKFLLDTNAISEVIKSKPDDGFLAWFVGVISPPEELDDRLHISVLTIGELRRGVLKLDAGRRRHDLAKWVDDLTGEYGDRILSVDLAVVETGARLGDGYRKRGVHVGLSDELIAATALVHGLTLVTRNVRHFEHSGCKLLSPWSE